MGGPFGSVASVRAWGNALLLLAVAAVNLSIFPIPQPPQPPGEFVKRQGTQLLRHGQPFRFVGVNCYRLAERSDWGDEIFATLAAHGVKVVRFWAFQKHCGPTGTDFTKFDALVEAAIAHDILLLPVLENQWAACTYGPDIKQREWYESGWREQRFGPLSYREYVRAVAVHFRNAAQILAWQLINEPEIWPDTEENFAVLRRFAVEAAQELKAMDPNHMVSLGLLGLGQPSTTGKRYRALHDTTRIDVVSAHDHGYIFYAMPGNDAAKPQNSFYADLCDARRLGKPFLATESCVPLPWINGDEGRRVELFRAKLDAFFAAGGAGYIVWNYEPRIESDCGFDAHDPVLGLLGEASVKLTRPSSRRALPRRLEDTFRDRAEALD